MLIRFAVENFRSFNEEAVFSMLPGRMQKHPEHIISNERHGIDALRAALLYGANASGKSNLVRAMDFARSLILQGVRPKQLIPVEPFRLDKRRLAEPSRFEFEFIAGDQAYAYGFAAGRRRIYEEWLYAINVKNEQMLFERSTDNEGITQAKFGRQIIKNDEERQFLDFVVRGTRPNQLLLTETAENNVRQFEPAYEWFRNRLTIIFPHSRARGVQVGVYKDQKFTQALTAFLQAMDTGIDEVCAKQIDPEALNFPLELLTDDLDKETEALPDQVQERMIGLDSSRGQRYLLRYDKENLLEAYSLGTRRRINGESVDFELFEESDGTQRLFDLFPILYGNQERVFVIDELERSLHPNLVYRFIRHFLESANNNQLIVTTHESTLLDLDLLRRDAIWFVEKSPTGASTIYSLETFKPRHDLDIRKGYLHGRFGAVPVFDSLLFEEQVET